MVPLKNCYTALQTAKLLSHCSVNSNSLPPSIIVENSLRYCGRKNIISGIPIARQGWMGGSMMECKEQWRMFYSAGPLEDGRGETWWDFAPITLI